MPTPGIPLQPDHTPTVHTAVVTLNYQRFFRFTRKCDINPRSSRIICIRYEESADALKVLRGLSKIHVAFVGPEIFLNPRTWDTPSTPHSAHRYYPVLINIDSMRYRGIIERAFVFPDIDDIVPNIMREDEPC